jgi:hypothetical protein
MAKFKNMKDVADFLVKDYRFQNLLSSVWGEDVSDYDEEDVENAANEIAETWDYVEERNSARWGIGSDDESLRRALSDWYAEQLGYGDEFSYVAQKKAEYDAAEIVYRIYKEV